MKENGYGLHDKKLSNILTNKTDCHDITEKLLKVALNTITLTPISSVFLYLTRLVYFDAKSLITVI
jgi:hypothetical protein